MSDQQYTIANLSRATIVLGRQLDNRVRRIVFDVTSWLQEYPEGTITLYVIPPEGDGYPAKIDMDNGKAIWTILESDTAYSGRGMAQLQLIGKNGEKLHSANANTLIEPSAAANAGSTPPNAAKPWFDDVQERLKRIEEAGGVTDEQVAGAVESYLVKNPDAAGAKIDDAQASEKTTYSSKLIKEKLSAQKEAIDDKLDADKLPTAINTALTQAKESGEFKGDPGEPGKDYVLTDADKQKIAAKVPVPTALPNPFPLTINGQSYDGSKAVNVNVEGDGGSEVTGSAGTWELAVNRQLEEDCVEASFSETDLGESFTKYRELIILFHLKGNSGNGSDVAVYTTGIHFGFQAKTGGWISPFDSRLLGFAVDESKHVFNIYHMLKTPYGILSLGIYSQYNSNSMSNYYSIVGATGVHRDAALPIPSNTSPTLEMTTFSDNIEFERFVIGGYQKVIGAGSIVKIWGCT